MSAETTTVTVTIDVALETEIARLMDEFDAKVARARAGYEIGIRRMFEAQQ